MLCAMSAWPSVLASLILPSAETAHTLRFREHPQPARLSSVSHGVAAFCPQDCQKEPEKESLSGDRPSEAFLPSSPACFQTSRSSSAAFGARDVLGQASWVCRALHKTFWCFLWWCGETEVGSAGSDCGDVRAGGSCPLGGHGAVQTSTCHFVLCLSHQPLVQLSKMSRLGPLIGEVLPLHWQLWLFAPSHYGADEGQTPTEGSSSSPTGNYRTVEKGQGQLCRRVRPYLEFACMPGYLCLG